MLNRALNLAAAITFILFAVSAHADAPSKRLVPPQAQSVINKVHAAAAARDFSALNRLMTKDFTWSFGGDGDSSQALAAWREDPTYLKNLHRVTGRKCEYTADNYVECPIGVGTGYRAGFKNAGNGWLMVYFVAGD